MTSEDPFGCIGFPSNFFQSSSRIRVDLLSYDSKPTEIWGLYDWMAEKYLDGLPISEVPETNLCSVWKKMAEIKYVDYKLTAQTPSKNFQPSTHIALVYQSVCSSMIADWLYPDYIIEFFSKECRIFSISTLYTVAIQWENSIVENHTRRWSRTYTTSVWLTRPIFFCDPVVLVNLLSYKSKPTEKRG